MSHSIKINTMLDNEPLLTDSKYIYSLYLGEKCVYVGQSADVRSRVYTHLSSRKSFDSVSYFICDNSIANESEAAQIVKENPQLNNTLPPTKNYQLVGNLAKDISLMINEKSDELNIAYQCGDGSKIKRYITSKHASKIKQSILEILKAEIK